MDFVVPVDHIGEIKENENTGKYLQLARELKKSLEHDGDSDTYCCWCARNDTQRHGKGAGRVENRRTSRDYPDFYIIKIGQNTEI